MSNITLICTVHKEHGNCNSNELYKIIEAINPEIIFEEIHPNRFDAYYKTQSVSTLETKAIIQYLKNHQIEHIPVDNYDIPDIQMFYKEVDYMHENIFDNSNEYCYLFEQRQLLLTQHGFNYINSDHYKNLSNRLVVLEETVIKHLNDKYLFRIYTTWKEFNYNRETKIIKNIYNYSNEHRYNNAILVIGSEHGSSIIKIIEEYKIKNESKINWNYKL
jgi:hypothetical protein